MVELYDNAILKFRVVVGWPISRGYPRTQPEMLISNNRIGCYVIGVVSSLKGRGFSCFFIFYFLSFRGPSGSPFAVCFTLFLEGEILDCLAHSLVI